MNILMIRTSQERQQKFLKRLFKQDQEAHRHEREKDREFLLKIGQMFLNNNERHVLLQIRKHVVLYTLCNLHLYRLILLFLRFLWQDYLLKFNIFNFPTSTLRLLKMGESSTNISNSSDIEFVKKTRFISKGTKS